MRTEGSTKPECALCPFDWADRACRHEGGKSPKNCPGKLHPDTVRDSIQEVQSPRILEFAAQASIQEAEGYGDRDKGYAFVRPIKPRIEEVMEFASRMRYRRLALIFCIGLRREAGVVHRILAGRGFDVLSVACKVGGVPKEVLGLDESRKVAPGSYESMCNPILQAMIANRYGSDFNVLLGLCVGHDSMFFRYAEAPTTVLAVKDRLLGHNPLAAVYQYEGYYRYLKKQP
ncbi:MAG: DUF1847 domain-containing protein [Syntrophobacteraceae bacterium]|nr:DUF1847 domain-containing protein [Syntrophobacteraceae bacterium]